MELAQISLFPEIKQRRQRFYPLALRLPEDDADDDDKQIVITENAENDLVAKVGFVDKNCNEMTQQKLDIKLDDDYDDQSEVNSNFLCPPNIAGRQGFNKEQ